MFFSKKELDESINNNDFRIRNYLETFGFVVIRNIIEDEHFGELDREFDSQLEARIGETTILSMLCNRIFSKNKKFGFRSILRRLRRAPGILFVGNFFDHSKIFTNLFFSENFTKKIEYFAGKNWIYFGSDGQKYVRSGFSWHRDWNTRPPIYKMFFKMTGTPQLGGDFMVIPGTHGVADDYAKNINKSMMWPLACQDHLDGMSEKNFLVRIKNPRQFTERFSKTLKDVPHVKVKLNKGDALIFNTSLPHNLSQGFPNFEINMMSILFAPNPLSNINNQNAKDDLDYLIDLMVNERNHCKVDPYGPELSKHSFFDNKNHFIDVLNENGEYVGGTLRFSGIEHKRLIPFEFYKTIGSEYRKSISASLPPIKRSTVFGSYSDVHLGIVCRFLDEN